MSGISKTIEEIKVLKEKAKSGDPYDLARIMEAESKSIMPIITAYEQSQKELEKVKVENQKRMDLQRDASGACIGLRAELEVANKRIAELEDEINRAKLRNVW